MDAAWIGAKERAAARRETKEKRDRLAVSLAMAGLSADEIATKSGIARRTARRLCARLGIERSLPGYKRTPCVSIPAAVFDQIAAVAGDCGEDVAATIVKLLTFAFEPKDDSLRARQMLRVKKASSDLRRAA